MDGAADFLKGRYQYEGWQSGMSGDEGLFVWKFFLVGDELPGLEAIRTRAVQAPGWPPSLQSIWRPPDKGDQMLVRLDVFECDSREGAHEFLIRFLGEFQGPFIDRQPGASIGDVGFAAGENTTAVFARGNVVVGARNAGREVAPVMEFAAAIDEHISSRPQPEGRVAPEIRRFEPAGDFHHQRGGRLMVEASDPLDRPLWFKFFSEGGEVLLEEGVPVFRPDSPGAGRVTVVAVNANRGVASRTFEVGGGTEAELQ